MFDQLIIGDKASYDDFFASVAERKIKKPAKKSIKETIPFFNGAYDFSKINGETYWEERELEYIFEMTANTPEELEDQKLAFSGWIMNVFEEEIHDPYIFGYHFKGTYDDMDVEDDEGLDKSIITVKFKAYPYMIADNATVFIYSGNAISTVAHSLLNSSHHPVRATVKVEPDDISMVIKINEEYITLVGGVQYELATLPVGLNEVLVTALTDTSGNGYRLSISFNEEVL